MNPYWRIQHNDNGWRNDPAHPPNMTADESRALLNELRETEPTVDRRRVCQANPWPAPGAAR